MAKDIYTLFVEKIVELVETTELLEMMIAEYEKLKLEYEKVKLENCEFYYEKLKLEQEKLTRVLCNGGCGGCQGCGR